MNDKIMALEGKTPEQMRLSFKGLEGMRLDGMSVVGDIDKSLITPTRRGAPS
jgi:hypothetical protein